MADAQDSKSCEGNFMWVQVPPSAPRTQKNRFDLFFLFILLNQGTFTLYSGPRRLRRHPKYTTKEFTVLLSIDLKIHFSI